MFPKSQKEIPINCNVRNVNIVCFCSGDTAFLFQLVLRKNFMSCRCLFCNLKANEWQGNSTCGNLYCNNDFNRIQSDLAITQEELNLQLGDDVAIEHLEELHNSLLGEAREEAHRGGVAETGTLILPAIELKTNFCIMVLHIKLGLTLTLYNQSFLFIFDNIELESDAVKNARVELRDIQVEYQVNFKVLKSSIQWSLKV